MKKIILITTLLSFAQIVSAEETYNFQFQKAPVAPANLPSATLVPQTEVIFSTEPIEDENNKQNPALKMEAQVDSKDTSKPHPVKVRLGFAQFENAQTEYVGPAYHSGLNFGVEYKMNRFVGFEGNVMNGKAKSAVSRWKEDEQRTVCCDGNGDQYTITALGGRYDDEVPNEMSLYRAGVTLSPLPVIELLDFSLLGGTAIPTGSVKKNIYYYGLRLGLNLTKQVSADFEMLGFSYGPGVGKIPFQSFSLAYAF
jgi:hypothetical protein